MSSSCTPLHALSTHQTTGCICLCCFHLQQGNSPRIYISVPKQHQVAKSIYICCINKLVHIHNTHIPNSVPYSITLQFMPQTSQLPQVYSANYTWFYYLHSSHSDNVNPLHIINLLAYRKIRSPLHTSTFIK